MYITTGSIEQLVTWFDELSSYRSANILCLIVGGDTGDAKFFKEIYEHKETLDTISGKDVSIFLFAKENNKYREYEQEVSLVPIGQGSFMAFPIQFSQEFNKKNQIKIFRVSQGVVPI